jgi:hypothetical protein
LTGRIAADGHALGIPLTFKGMKRERGKDLLSVVLAICPGWTCYNTCPVVAATWEVIDEIGVPGDSMRDDLHCPYRLCVCCFWHSPVATARLVRRNDLNMVAT